MSGIQSHRSIEDGEILEQPSSLKEGEKLEDPSAPAINNVPTVKYYCSKEAGAILEVRREGDSYVLPSLPQNTSSTQRVQSPSHSVRSSGDKKRPTEGRTVRLLRFSITPFNSMMETSRVDQTSPCSPILAYQDPYDAYEVLRLVGQGGEGACLLVQRKSDRELRVCKVSKRWKHDNADNVAPREASILRDVLPPNDRIITFYGLTVTPQTTQIYFDFYDGGDLSNFIDNYYFRSTEIPESFIWHAVLQLAEAVAFLHYGYDRHSQRPTQRDWKKVIHRDIKPANILLRLPNYSVHNPDSFYAYPSLVLADFGLATLTPTSNRVGTYVWQPPEVPHSSLAGDCWAVGAVIHALALDGCPPIDRMPPHLADNRRNREDWLTSRRSRKVWSIRHSYTVELEDCMFGALTNDPWYRFNALEILAAAVKHYETTTLADDMLGHWAFNQL
ncbi:Serine/threonine-protein kinase Nek2 [Sticta canariensis]|nr:Serine/threonine-protein kinase Nek2 [Sticta canariensis]